MTIPTKGAPDQGGLSLQLIRVNDGPNGYVRIMAGLRKAIETEEAKL